MATSRGLPLPDDSTKISKLAEEIRNLANAVDPLLGGAGLGNFMAGSAVPADMNTAYGNQWEGTFRVATQAAADAVLNKPAGAGPGVVNIYAMGSTASIQEWRNAADARTWERRANSTPASNTAWVDTTGGKLKRVAEPLTLPGSNPVNVSKDIGVRIPFRVPAEAKRWRVYIRNYNDRTSTAYAGALSFTGVTIGLGAVDANGRPTGQFNGGKNAVSGAFTSSSAGAQWVSPWMDYTLEAGKNYVLSYGYTTALAQSNHAGIAGAFLTAGGAAAINTDATTLTKTDAPPLDVWIAYEVDHDVPQFAYLGDSYTAGVSADLPVYDSWAKTHAMAHGAFAQIYGHSGTGYTEWTDGAANKFQKYTGFSGVAKPERLYVAMGSNDLASATAATVRTRFDTTMPLIKAATTDRLYLVTIPPRHAAAGATFETNRKAWNAILRTLPGNALACYDAAAALEAAGGSVVDLLWAASDTDFHLNRAGYARYAAAMTAGRADTRVATLEAGALQWSHAAGRAATALNPLNGLPQLVYGDTGWRDITSTVPAGITANNLRIRRVGNTVFVNVQTVSSTTAGNISFVSMPAGFAADPTVLRAGLAADRLATSIRHVSPFGGGIRILEMETGKSYESGFSFTTNDPWPTALPGTAVGAVAP